jgi:hypothetical protein
MDPWQRFGVFCLVVASVAFVLTAVGIEDRAVVALLASVALFELGLVALLIGAIERRR